MYFFEGKSWTFQNRLVSNLVGSSYGYWLAAPKTHTLRISPGMAPHGHTVLGPWKDGPTSLCVVQYIVAKSNLKQSLPSTEPTISSKLSKLWSHFFSAKALFFASSLRLKNAWLQRPAQCRVHFQFEECLVSACFSAVHPVGAALSPALHAWHCLLRCHLARLRCKRHLATGAILEWNSSSLARFN